MRSLAIVDTGPIVASLDAREVDHAACVDVLRRRDLRLVVPALVIVEVGQLIEKRLGPRREASFLRSVTNLEVESPEAADWRLIADLVERYADLDIGTVDASIAVLADRLRTDLVVTLDRRHFGAIRTPVGKSLRLLPEPPAVHEQPGPYEAGEA